MYFHLEQKGLPYEARSGRGLSYIPHLHKHMEIVLMKQGKSLAKADAKEVLLKPGDLFIAFPNQVHCYIDEPEPLECCVLIISPDMCPEFHYEFKNCLPVSPALKGAGDNPKIVSAIENIIECRTSNGLYSEIIVRGNLLILLSELFQSMPLTRNKPCDTNLVTDIINYCYENYDDDISQQALSDALNVSHYYISHLFSERLHVSFRDYINSLRIGKACELLKTNEKTVTDIAYAVGYNSTRTFNRCFLKAEGVTPREYRENMIAKNVTLK